MARNRKTRSNGACRFGWASRDIWQYELPGERLTPGLEDRWLVKGRYVRIASPYRLETGALQIGRPVLDTAWGQSDAREFALAGSRAEGMVACGGRSDSATGGGAGAGADAKANRSPGNRNPSPPNSLGGFGSGCGRAVRSSGSRQEEAVADRKAVAACYRNCFAVAPTREKRNNGHEAIFRVGILARASHLPRNGA